MPIREGVVAGITTRKVNATARVCHALTGKTWEVVVIRSGWSLNGVFYPSEVLEAAMPLLDGARVRAWSLDVRNGDHVPGGIDPKTFFANDLGVLKNIRMGESDGRPAVYADFEIEDESFAKRLLNAVRENRKLPELSIDGIASLTTGVAEGRTGSIVQEIESFNEVTVVGEGAAGGRFNRIAASKKSRGADIMKWAKMKRFLRKRGVQIPSSREEILEAVIEEAGSELDGAAAASMLKLAMSFLEAGNSDQALEVLTSLLEIVSTPTAGSPADAGAEEVPSAAELDAMPIVDPNAVPVGASSSTETPVAPPAPVEEAGGIDQARAAFRNELQKMKAEFKNELASVTENMKLEECARALDGLLAEAKLPKIADLAIRKRFVGKTFDPKQLKEALDEMKSILGSVGGDGVVTHTDAPARVQVGTNFEDRMNASLDLLLGLDYRADRNLSESKKDLYRDMSRSLSLRKIWEAYHGVGAEEFREGAGMHVTESTSASFAIALGTSAERRIMAEFSVLPKLWEQFAEATTVNNFKQQDRIRLGGFGELPIFNESNTVDYSDGGMFSEQSVNYSIDTRGYIVTITRRMIIDDDMQMLRRLPGKLAQAAITAQNRRAFAALIGNLGGGGVNTDLHGLDNLSVFNAAHFNVGTSAMSYSSVMAARQAMLNQSEPGNVTAITDNPLAQGATTINVVSTAGFHAGDVFSIGAELVKIGVVASLTQFTGCTRGIRGTTDAQHAASTKIYQESGPLFLSKLLLVYPNELETTATAILGSEKVPGGANNDMNFLNGEFRSGRLIPLSVPSRFLEDDLTNWYMCSTAKEAPPVELGFLNGRQEPELLLQNDPVQGNVFVRDNIRYKVRIEFDAVNLDWRRSYGSIV